jgi:hypothetical protein
MKDRHIGGSNCLFTRRKREQITTLARPVQDANFSPWKRRNCVIDCSIALNLTWECLDVAVGCAG